MSTIKEAGVQGQILFDEQSHIDGRIFPDAAVSSTCAGLAHRYFFNLHMEEDSSGGTLPFLVLSMERKDGKVLADEEPKAFLNVLFAQKTRLELQAEFGRLRDRIVDYAFAPLEKRDA